MKKSILILGLMLVLFSCTTSEDETIIVETAKKSDTTIRNYSSENGVNLQLTFSNWYTEKTTNGFGIVHLTVSGSTNADKITVLTHGDGLLSGYNLILDSDQKFTNRDAAISFTHAASDEAFSSTTEIKATRGNKSLIVVLNSGELQY